MLRAVGDLCASYLGSVLLRIVDLPRRNSAYFSFQWAALAAQCRCSIGIAFEEWRRIEKSVPPPLSVA